MQAAGVDAFLDIHGDEALPYVFTDGNERLPIIRRAWRRSSRGSRRRCRFANPDFQTVHGYPADKETKVNLTVASKWVGHTFGGPRTDAGDALQGQRRLPDPVHGWNGARSQRLGADTLTALYAMLPSL